MKLLTSFKASNSSIIWLSIGSTILPAQNKFTTLGTIPQLLRNHLEITTSSINPPYPKTPPTWLVFSQEIEYVIKDIKIPIPIVEDYQKATTPYEIAQRILPKNWHYVP